jgi:hypothetical protein
MVFRQNYGSKRADRNRAQKSRNEEKLRLRQERSDQRKAERERRAVDTGVAEQPLTEAEAAKGELP